MQYIERVMDDLKKMKDEGLLDVSEDLKALKESEQFQAKVLDENAVSTLGE